MKREDIRFPHDVRNPFLSDHPFVMVRMMNNEVSANQAVIDSCLAAAANTEQFIDFYVSRKKECRGEQFYTELVQKERPRLVQGEVWDCFQENGFFETSTRFFNTGWVAIGNGPFALSIPVDSIYGWAKVAIFSQKSGKFWCKDFMDYFAVARGTTHIYKDDAFAFEEDAIDAFAAEEDAIAATLDKTAYIYKYADCVAFELVD